MPLKPLGGIVLKQVELPTGVFVSKVNPIVTTQPFSAMVIRRDTLTGTRKSLPQFVEVG
jgi:hypothetical protein